MASVLTVFIDWCGIIPGIISARVGFRLIAVDGLLDLGEAHLIQTNETFSPKIVDTRKRSLVVDRNLFGRLIVAAKAREINTAKSLSMNYVMFLSP